MMQLFWTWFTPDKIIALATVIYALVTIVMFIEIRAQTKASSHQSKIAEIVAKAAQQSADALMMTEQAWIVVTVDSIFPAPESQEITVIVRIKNYGRTPAKVTRVATELNILVTPEIRLSHDSEKFGSVTYGRLPEIPKYRDTPFTEGPIVLVIGQEISFSLMIGRDDFSQIRKQNAFAEVYGIVQYRDIFGRNREPVKFFYSYSTYTGTGSWDSDGPPAYDNQN
jgi:hypothetical protein